MSEMARRVVRSNMDGAGSHSLHVELLSNVSTVCDAGHWRPDECLLKNWISTALATLANPDWNGVQLETSLKVVDGDEIQRLNRQYRDKDATTNVLSFPSDMPVLPASEPGEMPRVVLGDIVICPEVLELEAAEQGKPLQAHWTHLVVHSVLHLAGMDHDDDLAAETMETLEIQILSSLGIPNPYLAASATKS